MEKIAVCESVEVTKIADVEAYPSQSNSPGPTQSEGGSGNAILVVGGRCVNDDLSFQSDVLIEDGIIKEVGENLNPPPGAKVIDIKGKLIIPGGIDTNTLFDFKHKLNESCDDFYTGSRAALAGGTTMFVDCGGWGPRGESLIDQLEARLNLADKHSCCDFALSPAITWWSDKVASDMKKAVSELGVNSFRVSQQYKDSYMLDDGDLMHVLREAKRNGALIMSLAENGHITDKKAEELISLGITGPEGHAMSHPEESEAEATQRVIVLANQVRAPVCVGPVTGRAAASLLADARRRGHVVFGEASSAALVLDGSAYWNSNWDQAAGYVTTPPFRPDPTTPAALTDYLANGDLHTAASTHCAFTRDVKAAGRADFRLIPHGVTGAQERLGAVWQAVVAGRMDPCRFVAATSSTAAKLLNIYPRKGRIAVGSDADIVVWDPEASQTNSASNHESQCDYNIFETLQFRGSAALVFSRGRIVKDENGLHVEKGWGRFIHTLPNCEFIYGRITARDLALAPERVIRGDDLEPEIEAIHVDTVDRALIKDQAGTLQPESIGVASVGPGGDRFHQRPPTRSGGRHMQESSFSLSGDQFDDSTSRPSSRILNPPGGRSSGIW